MHPLSRTALLLATLLLLSPLALPAQQKPAAMPPTALSAELGNCSALITVTDAAGKPIFNAKVSARVRYGFLGIKKMDLEAYTSAGGQVNFTHLPEKVKQPVTIYVAKGEQTQSVVFDPQTLCQATFTVQLK
jgi:hypothetical protein